MRACVNTHTQGVMNKRFTVHKCIVRRVCKFYMDFLLEMKITYEFVCLMQWSIPGAGLCLCDPNHMNRERFR